MKKALITLAALVGLTLSALAQGYTCVDSYYRSNGSFVSGHYRTTPDGNFYNNWSTSGNYNPFTGQPGYRTSPRR